jgi:hypothetical protein
MEITRAGNTTVEYYLKSQITGPTLTMLPGIACPTLEIGDKVTVVDNVAFSDSGVMVGRIVPAHAPLRYTFVEKGPASPASES